MKTFEDYYEKNITWLDDENVSPLLVLRTYYPDYFNQNNEVNYQLLKKDLLDSSKKSARELIKSLFCMPYKTLKNTIMTEDLEVIERDFGHTFIAHGIEGQKGGMYILLMMGISNQVRVPSQHWGYFKDGLPNISPVNHGPYYLIYNLPTTKQMTEFPHYPKFTDVSRILVPFVENKEMLLVHIDAMVKCDLIDDQMRINVMAKLRTYSEFLIEVKALVPTTAVSGSSFFKQAPAPHNEPSEPKSINSII